MWDYNETVRDHFLNPRNVGDIKEADGEGLVGSMACGDALKLMFKLDDEGRIENVKFQTFGCASAIASSSALTEIIKGKTLDEAAEVTNQEIANFLGGLPDQKMHCSVMGRDAMLLAIDNYKKKQNGVEAKNEVQVDSDLVCACFGVTHAEIERAIKENKLTTVEEVTNFTKAGGGCGGCIPQIEEILTEVSSALAPVPVKKEKPNKKNLTTIQKIQLIQETIEREIRPQLKKDGGDIELVDLDGNMVIVSMRGNCAHCKVASFTLKNVVERKLREFVSEDLEVVEAATLEEEA